ARSRERRMASKARPSDAGWAAEAGGAETEVGTGFAAGGSADTSARLAGSPIGWPALSSGSSSFVDIHQYHRAATDSPARIRAIKGSRLINRFWGICFGSGQV